MSASFELWINNTLVDMKDSFPLSITNSIADIMKPDTRQTSYSKTIVIPGSKSNRDLFTYIFELSHFIDSSGTVNYDPDFNPNLKASAIALCDTVEIFNGIAQLLKINIIDNDNIEFEIVITGQLTNLFKNIGDSELTDLDFSEYNHDYTLSNIEGSWLNSSGYVYPLIDYGYSSDQIHFSVTQLRPAIFVKQIIDKIFSDAGCVYDSVFFDSSFFGDLIIPFTGQNFKMTSTEVLDRKFRASRETTDQQFSVTEVLTNTRAKYNDDSTGLNFDTSGQYTPLTGAFEVGTGLGGTFNFSTFIDLTATFVPDTASIDVKCLKALLVYISFIKEDSLGNLTILNTIQTTIKPNNNASFPINTNYETTSAWSLTNGSYTPQKTGKLYIQSNPVFLQPTDKVYVNVKHYFTDNSFFTNIYGSENYADDEKFIDSGFTLYDGDFYLNINIGSYLYNEIANADYAEGMTINMNSVLPEKIKQKDFLMSIIKMFNLYIESDKEVSNKFIIEPRDDGYFYDASLDSNIVNLTSKLDISQQLEIEPMGALDFKTYYFKYKEDKDYFNQYYLNKWNETYSERKIDITNDFIVNTKTTDVIFSPTPSVGNTSSDRVIPRILNMDVNGTVTPVAANPRILIWSGLKSSNAQWFINEGGNNTAYDEYPYAGMLDDPYSPTVSLDWEVPDEIFWTNGFQTITYTNKNLFNKYWKKFINEITDRNSKIVRGWFNIRPYDYVRLDFRKLYFFENEFFRLNKVINYNPLNNSLTQLEFIKINEGIETVFSAEELDNVPTFDLKPVFNGNFSGGGNIVQPGAFKSGTGNRVADSVSSYRICGDNNTIGEGSEAIFIDGDENVIAGNSSGVMVTGSNNLIGGSNITILNTFNKTIDKSNCTYINGRIVSGDGMVENVVATKTIGFSGNDDATVYLCDATAGNIVINLPACGDIGIIPALHIKKVDSSVNTVTINPDGTETIDGDLTLIITTQWDSVMIVNDGLNWFIIK